MDLVLDEADRLAAPEATLGVVAGRRRDRTGAHSRERFADRLRVLLDRAFGRQRHGRGQARLLAGRRGDEDLLVRQSGGVLGRHDHVGAVGEQDYLLRGNRVDPGEQVVRRGVERGAAVDRVHAELVEELAQPVPADDGDRAAACARSDSGGGAEHAHTAVAAAPSPALGPR